MNISKILFAFIICLIFVGCQQKSGNSNCDVDAKLPAEAFNYPDNLTAEDSSVIYAGYKDSLSTSDSFTYAYTGNQFLPAFDEANLSLQYSGKSFIRISYDSHNDTPFVLTLHCKNSILKIGESGILYPDVDYLMLDEKEQFHLWLLKRYFPFNSAAPTRETKAYEDSLTLLYPELLSPLYYRTLLEKSVQKDSFPFKFTTYQKPIEPGKFEYFFNLLEKAAFWSLPQQMSPKSGAMDGSGYTVEIHTPTKFRLIVSSNCPKISEALTSACQEIIDHIKMESLGLSLCDEIRTSH
ncbi:MAG: hypothetical protein H7Y86_21735 [Rhizobacter sp.]|nr:hypothetical protein [Ferruginibacter sp.]